MVFLSTPFILVSRRPHMEGIRHMSEYFMCFFAPLLSLALALGIGYLVDIKANWLINMLVLWWIASTYLTPQRFVNARLPDVSFRKWLVNISAIYFGIMVAIAPTTFFHQLLADRDWHPVASFVLSVPVLVACGTLALKVLGRCGLLYDTVGSDSHITVSIQRVLKDFEQPSLPTDKALYVRFTSDEASLSLALAQGLSKLIDFCMNGFLSVLSVASPSFWRAGRRRLGIAARMIWLAALCVVLFLLTNSAVNLLLGVAGLLEAAMSSLFDAVIHLKVPDTWNFSHSMAIELAAWLEPYLAWSLDLGSGRHPQSVVNAALAAPILILTCLAALLSLPFGAAYFWSAVHVEFSVEATPAGECTLVTFCPQATGSDESAPDLWDQSLMAHSLSYTDPRSIERVCEQIKSWIATGTELPAMESPPTRLAAEGQATAIASVDRMP
ncbi:hypothetical protein ABE85_01695 [Mitsuaria sp. 7]|nr:hypothetical protein ABE85_01695 [Mitsuaria sp. 7]